VQRKQAINRINSAFVVVAMLWIQAAIAFDFNDVAQRAEQLASSPYKKPTSNLPKELENLDYDKFRDIRFKPEKSHWRSANLPFELTFFHQGWHYNLPVRINEITKQGVQEIKLNPADYDYGANKFNTKEWKDVGFSGFRVHFPINTPQYKDEVLVFLGASYFRALGKAQIYGLSARGLAIDTAMSSGEEFPRFVEFWLERPTTFTKQLVIYGLLDSPRATGAYRFVVTPGASTTMDVTARVIMRDNVGKLGIAPLTSMLYFGENQFMPVDDYRPEVHDSDGLQVHTGNDEWLWRPLVNPKRLLTTSFTTTNPRGFGLMQRDRDFTHYEDLEARYEKRPSAWIEPKGNWGPGRVELVQIPTPDETNDNIVAYWLPDAPPKPRVPYNFEYRISWQKEAETRPPSAWVVQTRRGNSFTKHPDGSIGLILDFDGPSLRKMSTEAKMEAVVSIDANGQLLENTLYPNVVTGAWRQSIRVRRVDNDKPIELRSYLRSNNTAISETWSYILPPE
jgi:glucans biosynthesis protein